MSNKTSKELKKLAHKFVLYEYENNGYKYKLDKINDEDVRLCIDVGHAELPKIHSTTAPDMIRKCGKYLGCLHIQDNDKFHDSHTLPGLGLLDFDEIVKALKEVNYQGDLTYEADGYVYYSNDDYTLRYKCLPEIYKNGIELLSKFK